MKAAIRVPGLSRSDSARMAVSMCNPITEEGAKVVTGASGPPRWGGGKRVSDGDEGGTNLWEPSLVLREAGAKT